MYKCENGQYMRIVNSCFSRVGTPHFEPPACHSCSWRNVGDHIALSEAASFHLNTLLSTSFASRNFSAAKGTVSANIQSEFNRNTHFRPLYTSNGAEYERRFRTIRRASHPDGSNENIAGDAFPTSTRAFRHLCVHIAQWWNRYPMNMLMSHPLIA